MVEISSNDIYAYGDIGSDIRGEEFARAVRAIDRFGKPVVHLHSYGGDMLEGLVMYNALRAAKHPTTVVVEGFAASMAAIIMLSATKVRAAANALIMVHAPTLDLGGNTRNHEEAISILRTAESSVKTILEARGISPEVSASWLDGEDHWFTAQEAKAAGLVDEVVGAVVSASVRKPGTGDTMPILRDVFMPQLKAQIPKKENIMNEELLKLLGLKDGATEQQIIDAVQHLRRMAEQRDELMQARTSELLDAAVKNGSIEAGQVETFRQIGATMGLDTLRAALEGRPGRQRVASMIQVQSGGGFKKKFDDYTSAELLAMRERDRERYDALLEEKYK